jgi:hypothetical protein
MEDLATIGVLATLGHPGSAAVAPGVEVAGNVDPQRPSWRCRGVGTCLTADGGDYLFCRVKLGCFGYAGGSSAAAAGVSVSHVGIAALAEGSVVRGGGRVGAAAGPGRGRGHDVFRCAG